MLSLHSVPQVNLSLGGIHGRLSLRYGLVALSLRTLVACHVGSVATSVILHLGGRHSLGLLERRLRLIKPGLSTCRIAAHHLVGLVLVKLRVIIYIVVRLLWGRIAEVGIAVLTHWQRWLRRSLLCCT